VPTVQQRAYGGEWLPFVDPADLPPVDQRPVVCLVDSGVAITNDLPADRPEGPIVSRRTLVEGAAVTGDPTPEGQHGTRMASMMGAVQNGIGTVGAVPWVRVVSVRAMVPGETTFRGGEYRRGIDYCAGIDVTSSYRVAAINLSLGCDCQLSATDRESTTTAVSRARQRRVAVVAAAGNRGGGLEAPADLQGVTAAAAGGSGGALCTYAASAPTAMIGPGCGIDTADGDSPQRSDAGGSSTAAAFISAVIAALRTWRPEATSEDIDGWLRAGRAPESPAALDAAASFQAAGLGTIVDRARARLQSAAVSSESTAPGPQDRPSPAPAEPAALAIPKESARLPLPDVVASYRKSRISVAIANWPKGALVEVTAQRIRGFVPRRLRRVTVRRSRFSFVVSQLPSRLVVRFVAAPPSRLVSAREYLTPNTSGRFR